MPPHEYTVTSRLLCAGKRTVHATGVRTHPAANPRPCFRIKNKIEISGTRVF